MKKRIASITLAATLMLGLLSGCGQSTASTAAETYDVLENPSVTVDGTWSAPDTDRSVSFAADGTYTSTIATRFSTNDLSGSYSYYAENDSFSLGELFGDEEYVVLSNQKGKEVLYGAVLGDLIVAYYDQDQCYFIREERQEEISEEDFLGDWLDATGGTYQLSLRLDGTGTVGEDDEMRDCTFTYDPEQYLLTITENSSDETYTVCMHGGYLFLLLNGNYYTMYMYEKQ